MRRLWRKVVPFISAGFLMGLVIVPLGLFGWLVFGTDVFSIQAVTVVDARESTMATVRTIVQEELERDFTMGRGNNLFFVRPEKIEDRILERLPQVRTAYVQRQLPGTLKIVVQEKTPAILLLVNNQYYFVDAAGIAYEEARLDALPGVVLPIVKNRNPDNQVMIGMPVVSESFVLFVRSMEEKISEAVEAEVVEVQIPSLAAREVQFQLSNNWRIRFDVTRSSASQLGLLKDLLEATISEEEKAQLDYIDLRIPSRIYYKLR